jgi:hypothetical protein
VSREVARRKNATTRRPAQRGDEAELFERHSGRLLRAVRRAIGGRPQVAEDACSFAWVQLLRTQPERDSIFPWLCVVATNEALRLLKPVAVFIISFTDVAVVRLIGVAGEPSLNGITKLVGCRGVWLHDQPFRNLTERPASASGRLKCYEGEFPNPS